MAAAHFSRQLSKRNCTSDTLSNFDRKPSPIGLGICTEDLKQVGAQHAQWHLQDTSGSGITGHSGKVDFCLFAALHKAWPQVVAVAETKRELQSESSHTECIGRLTARSWNIFGNQPHRKFVTMIAGGADQVEVLAFFRDGAVFRSGLQPWSFSSASAGLGWLCKLLFSSQAAMGFVPELPPFINTTPQGLFEDKTCFDSYFSVILSDIQRLSTSQALTCSTYI